LVAVLGINFFMVPPRFFLFFFSPHSFWNPKLFSCGYPPIRFRSDTRFQQADRIWVAEAEGVLHFRALHALGCTPDWETGENKFKCPSTAAGMTAKAVNFEGLRRGRWPRLRGNVPTGQIQVDTSGFSVHPVGTAGSILRGV